MTKSEVLQTIEVGKIVPVIRTNSESEAERLVAAILAGGIKIFEITLSVPNAPSVIERLAEKFGDRVLLGAGTVLNVEQAEQCFKAGAKFIVSPILNLDVVKFCRDCGIAVFPAGLTPNEIYAAANAKADAVKVFPVNSMGGAGYLKSLKAVFPHVKLMPTGGVNLETIADFFLSGAFAVGIGSDLADTKLLGAGNNAQITKLAENFIKKLLKNNN
ncbi:MAG: bifunctional 4-hydroxy-2-oxoglutarate aldolase/2-dehydro-3-deoxy-phosphogluconate aldolase [Acidobacteriota bacterium]|nr:bifunctional 4-hydroxy-2-oxoglutarate aldolase/2-dehydro-3-deoxy-phosphogluconate aldolase [Acidobacteriota bacterium]